MSHPYDVLDNSALNVGNFIFTPCPGTQQTTVREALSTLQKAGAQAVITLTSVPEMTALEVDVPAFQQTADELGLAWFILPVPDDEAPEEAFTNAWDQARKQIMGRINMGQTVAIHCRGGSGRTGLMAALLLKESGLPVEEAIKHVQGLRPKSLQNPAHLNYVVQH